MPCDYRTYCNEKLTCGTVNLKFQYCNNSHHKNCPLYEEIGKCTEIIKICRTATKLINLAKEPFNFLRNILNNTLEKKITN